MMMMNDGAIVSKNIECTTNTNETSGTENVREKERFVSRTAELL